MLTSVTLAYLSTEKSSRSVMKSMVKEQPITVEETVKPLAQEEKMAPAGDTAQDAATPVAEGAEQK